MDQVPRNNNVFFLFGAGFAFHFLYISSFKFVYFEDGFFEVKSIIKPDIKIPYSSYEKCYITLLDFPMSNTLILKFKDGRKIRIMGGTKKFTEIDLEIKRLSPNLARNLTSVL